MEDHRQLPSKRSLNQQKSIGRSNRVFILQYSPQRSKQKKKQQTNTSNPKQEMSHLINEYANSKQERSKNEFSHRSNLDRLAALISKSRSNKSSEGESGCKKLVKVVDRVIKIKCSMALALQKIKRYTMFCSSTNYQLFVQSKHNKYLSKQADKSNQLAKITELQALELSLKSSQLSIGLKKSIEQKQITFRNRDSRQFNQSLSRYLSQLNGGFKLKSRQYIATCQTLNSQQQLNQSNNTVGHTSTMKLKMQKSSIPIIQLEEQPFQNKSSLVDAQVQFLHLCHLKPQQKQNQSYPNPIDIIQIAKLLQIKGQNNQYIKPKHDFALPTTIIRNTALPQNINQNRIKKDKKRQILSSKQIADRMLFGQNRQQVVAKKQMVEIKRNNKKRVSSLPKIIFTYSQQKDMRLKFVPKVQKCAQAQLKNKSPLINLKIPSRNEQKMKIQVQSTFGSTKDLANTYQCPIPQFQSSPKIQNRPILKFPPQKIITKRPLVVTPTNANYNSNDYYAQTNYKQGKVEGNMNRPRERVITQVPQMGTGIEYVGIESSAQVECCLLQKNNRSRSLNDYILIGNWG